MSALLQYWDGLLWLLLMLGPFLFVQRWLHRQIQAVFLLLTRNPALTISLFSFLFFPGVVLHETSHFLVARLLGVRTDHFSLFPKTLPDGKLQLGYVETASTDFFREALIGAAPLLSGGVVVAIIGIFQLGLGTLVGTFSQESWASFWSNLVALPDRADFWLWFYLAFTISSTMLPSVSDRRGWLPLLTITCVLVVIAIVGGAGPWLVTNLAPDFNYILKALAVVFGISLALHIILLLPISLLHVLISRLTGLEVS